MLLAVTGTDGKSTVAHLARSILDRLGHDAVTIGTLGVGHRDGWDPLPPGCGRAGSVAPALRLLGVEPHAPAPTPDQAPNQGPNPGPSTRTAIVEAPSAWLARGAFTGVRPAVSTITNVTSDHLDVHGDHDTYAAAKLAVVAALLPHAVVVADASPTARRAQAWAEHHGRRCLRVQTDATRHAADGDPDDTVDVMSQQGSVGRRARVALDGASATIDVTSPADHDVVNVATAAATCAAAGWPIADVLAAAAQRPLSLPPGRMQPVATSARGAPVWVDYAHTPAALAACLSALRPRSGRLVVVFGCGGDRDRGKRPLMGRIADRLADQVIVTDDNPRSEDPSAIRHDIRRGCPRARDIPDRRTAIQAALDLAGAGDVVVLAGRGHEVHQAGGTTRHDDASIVDLLLHTERIPA